MCGTGQVDLFPSEEMLSLRQVEDAILVILSKHEQPSAWDLISYIERELGWKARWIVKTAVEELKSSPTSKGAWRSYFDSLSNSGDLDAALRGSEAPRKDVASSIDALLRQSSVYRDSAEFREMIAFLARFREYAPYNNMLVRIQNPSCSFYATKGDWRDRFDRILKEDARPMLILAPMHPVMLVYSLEETEGPSLPEELLAFAHFQGQWTKEWLDRTVSNAGVHDRIRVDFRALSSTHAGFATLARGIGEWKMRIAIHTGLDEPSQFGVLCHELAHIYLGHLGTDNDHWWPSRTDLDGRTVEIEAEASAYIVTSRFGLTGASAAYVSRYLAPGRLPASVSLDQIAKVAGRIEQMAERLLPRRQRRGERQVRNGR